MFRIKNHEKSKIASFVTVQKIVLNLLYLPSYPLSYLYVFPHLILLQVIICIHQLKKVVSFFLKIYLTHSSSKLMTRVNYNKAFQNDQTVILCFIKTLGFKSYIININLYILLMFRVRENLPYISFK